MTSILKEPDETVCKLHFVLGLVECVLDLAKSRRSALYDSQTAEEMTFAELKGRGGGGGGRGGGFVMKRASYLSESQCHLEQLVLYIRVLQLLSSAIQLARTEIKAGHLLSSASVKNSKSNPMTIIIILY